MLLSLEPVAPSSCQPLLFVTPTGLKLFCKYDGLKGGSKAPPVVFKESSDSLSRMDPKKRRLAKRRQKGLKANKLKEGKSPPEQQDQEVAIEEETQGTNGEEYEVKAIKDVRNREDGVKYFIKWKGYTLQHNHWVKEQNLHCDDLLVEFLRQQLSSNNEKSKWAKCKEKEVD
ncbi:putative Transposon Tf2-1 polyprotein [Balamuthia mandrillaris]